MTEEKMYYVQVVEAGDDEASYHWTAAGDEGVGDLAALKSAVADNPVTLLVPGALVRCFQTQLPPLSAAKTRQALPYAVEDALAITPEQCHFALFAVDHGMVDAAVIDHDTFLDFITPLQKEGIRLNTCVPEQLLLPWQEHGWTLVVGPECSWLRYGQWQGCAIATPDLPMVLQTFVAEHDVPEQLQVHLLNGMTQNDLTEHARVFFSHLEERNCEIRFGDEGQNKRFLPFIVSQQPSFAVQANLLQGEFKVKSAGTPSRKLWWTTASAWGLVALLFIVGKFYQHHQLTNELALTQHNILTQYQRVFPGSVTANSPRIVFSRALAELEQGAVTSPLLFELSALGQALQELPGVKLGNLSFANERTAVSLRLADFGDLEKLVQLLEQHGVSVKKDAAVAKEKHVEAKLQLLRGTQ